MKNLTVLTVQRQVIVEVDVNFAWKGAEKKSQLFGLPRPEVNPAPGLSL